MACVDQYDREMIEKLGNAQKIVTSCLLIAGLLLDGVCYKYRHLAVIIFYLDCAMIVTMSLVPSTLNESTLSFAVWSCLSVILFACHARSSIIIATVISVLVQFMIHPFVYINARDIFSTYYARSVCLVITVFFSATSFWMVFYHLNYLHTTISRAERERDAILLGTP